MTYSIQFFVFLVIIFFRYFRRIRYFNIIQFRIYYTQIKRTFGIIVHIWYLTFDRVLHRKYFFVRITYAAKTSQLGRYELVARAIRKYVDIPAAIILLPGIH